MTGPLGGRAWLDKVGHLEHCVEGTSCPGCPMFFSFLLFPFCLLPCHQDSLSTLLCLFRDVLPHDQVTIGWILRDPESKINLCSFRLICLRRFVTVTEHWLAHNTTWTTELGAIFLPVAHRPACMISCGAPLIHQKLPHSLSFQLGVSGRANGSSLV